jgi:uncharacterized protein YjbI with pentapeptide repeats
MDRGAFDSLARGLGAARTRRGALATLIGGALLGGGLDAEAKHRRKRRRRRRRQAAATVCYATETCGFLGPGKDYDGCDFSGRDFSGLNMGGASYRHDDFAGAVLDGANMQGAKFLSANFRGVSAKNADISGAGFNFACLFDADFTGTLFAGPVFAQAFLCRTVLPDGSVSNRDCASSDACCHD